MDEADVADKRIADVVADKTGEARRAVEAMPKGEPGDCELCGEWCGRLVAGACARCRDRYKLP